jgi:hypothetical protein
MKREEFRTVKKGDILSNVDESVKGGGRMGWDYLVTESFSHSNIYKDGGGRAKICLIIDYDANGKPNTVGNEYYMYESDIEDCLNLYIKSRAEVRIGTKVMPGRGFTPYVSHRTAKALDEIKIPYMPTYGYRIDTGEFKEVNFSTLPSMSKLGGKEYFFAPTLYEARNALANRYGIHVTVVNSYGQLDERYPTYTYEIVIPSVSVDISHGPHTVGDGDYDSAMDEGIYEAVKIILKNKDKYRYISDVETN